MENSGETKNDTANVKELLEEALRAANNLSACLQDAGDLHNMYKANRAWKELYNIKLPAA